MLSVYDEFEMSLALAFVLFLSSFSLLSSYISTSISHRDLDDLGISSPLVAKNNESFGAYSLTRTYQPMPACIDPYIQAKIEHSPIGSFFTGLR